MASLTATKVFLSSVFDPGIHEPLRSHFPNEIWDPRAEVARRPDQTIEQVCRDLIRSSHLFIGVFDERGGNAPFETGVAPVTVLEIELLQALFERLPIYLFLLPGFERNHRLGGLVRMAAEEGLASVQYCSGGVINCEGSRRTLTSHGIELVARAIRDPFLQRCSRLLKAYRRHLGFHKLSVSLLDCQLNGIQDPFEVATVVRQLDGAAKQKDHASRLSYLWPALRRLASVRYDLPENSSYHPLWEKLAAAWDRSAAWYGLHDGSPIGKLAAVNTFLWLLEHGGLQFVDPDFARGSRASAFYSMAKQLWLPWKRREMLRKALKEIEVSSAAAPQNPAGYLAIRGSIHLQLWHISAAARDYETVVDLRLRQNTSASPKGEALVELGWAYVWQLRFAKAKDVLRRGLPLMRQDFDRDPTLRQDFFVRALLKSSIAYLMMLDFSKAVAVAGDGCRLAREGAVDDQVRGLRRLLCKFLDSNRANN
jgi:hypothetical protein